MYSTVVNRTRKPATPPSPPTQASGPLPVRGCDANVSALKKVDPAGLYNCHGHSITGWREVCAAGPFEQWARKAPSILRLWVFLCPLDSLLCPTDHSPALTMCLGRSGHKDPAGTEQESPPFARYRRCRAVVATGGRPPGSLLSHRPLRRAACASDCYTSFLNRPWRQPKRRYCTWRGL